MLPSSTKIKSSIYVVVIYNEHHYKETFSKYFRNIQSRKIFGHQKLPIMILYELWLVKVCQSVERGLSISSIYITQTSLRTGDQPHNTLYIWRHIATPSRSNPTLRYSHENLLFTLIILSTILATFILHSLYLLPISYYNRL